MLRGLEPQATREEIEAASRQFVRKVSGVTTTSRANETAMVDAIEQIATVVEGLLGALPPRSRPPSTVPPLRRVSGRTAWRWAFYQEGPSPASARRSTGLQ